MKKSAIFPVIFALLAGISPNARADYGMAVAQMQLNDLRNQARATEVTMCGETSIVFSGTQSAKDDEFLYDSVDAFASVQNRRDGGTVNGTVFECGESHCPNGHIIVMGPKHHFKGRIVPETTQYQCSTSTIPGDRWTALSAGCQYRGTFLTENQFYGGTTPSNLTYNDCLQFDLNADKNATAFHAKCERVGGTLGMHCHATKCPDNMTLSNGKCVARAATPQPQQPATPTQPTTPVTPTPQPVNPVTPVQPVTPGPNPVPTAPYNCDATELVFVRTALTQWATNAQIVALANEIITYCNGTDRTAAEFRNKMAQLRALIAAAQQSATTARIQASQTRINGSVDALNNIKNNFDISRWKNEEGKFNTARLASDSIAGVVLGTAGGLITSNVIKKNQVNNGFDDIQCTIGGQVVAGWGDQFNVGIR